VAQGPKPSEWAVGRFGEHAAQLAELVPKALAVAVNRQIHAHLASGLDSLYAYGGAWPVVYEELVNHVSRLDGARVIRPKGKSFRLVMVNGSLLVPFRYADDLTTAPTDQRTTHRLNKTCQELLTTFGPPPPYEQGELFPAEAAEAPEVILGEVAPETVVMVFFAANAQAGLLAVGWGEAALVHDGSLAWRHDEALPLPKNITRPAIEGEPLPFDGATWPTEHEQGRDTRRFDSAPLPDPPLEARPADERPHADRPLSEQPPLPSLAHHDDA
jgi:hypothetical protein